MVSHIAGIPVEETALSLAPALMVVLAAGSSLRRRVGDWVRRRLAIVRAPAR